jgi:hypothetical protein
MSTGLVSRLASEIEPRAIEWLWPKRFALGKCALTAGDGDLGKTTLLLNVIATVTRGGYWPAGEGKAELGNVLYFSTEDDAEDTVIPRLMAAGADRDRIRIVTAVRRTDDKGDRAFDLAADLAKLEAEIVQMGNVRLVVFDPISAYFGRADTYRNSEVRAVLGPLADMAARHRVAVIGNTHFSKGGNGSANMRVLDSVAITAQARTVYVVIQDPEDPAKRMFLPSKGNLSPLKTGLRFHIDVVQVKEGIEGTRVIWEQGDIERTADQALADLAAKRKGPSALDDAAAWLREFLSAGPKPQTEIVDHAVNSGLHTEITLRRAAKWIGVVSSKGGVKGGWLWSLPADQPRRRAAPDPRLEFSPIDLSAEPGLQPDGTYDFS